MFSGSQDVSNFESDPEEFARTLCKDLNIGDPEVGVSKFIFYRKQPDLNSFYISAAHFPVNKKLIIVFFFKNISLDVFCTSE